MKSIFTVIFASIVLLMATETTLNAQTKTASGEIYEWRIYSLESSGAAGKLNKFMSDILIPAYNKVGVKVGAYGEYSQNFPPKQYYLFVYPNMQSFVAAKDAVLKNEAYVAAALKDAESAKPVYERYDSYLCRAFDAWKSVTPMAGKTIFEWRKYDGANENAVSRKVAMFANGEIEVFKACGIEPLAFGEILSGPNMPALIYVTQFDDMADRDLSWGKFGKHPKWNEMKGMPEYANTVSHIERVFLTPLSYNQLK